MSESRILTSHVGSLVRPPELIELLTGRQNGKTVAEDVFARTLDKAVDDVVKHQHEVGVDIVSDGEYPKTYSWSRYVMGRMNGLRRDREGQGGKRPMLSKERRDFAEFFAEYDAGTRPTGGSWVVDGPISYKGQSDVQGDITRLKSAVAKAKATQGFLAVVAPISVLAGVENQHYKNEDDLLAAIADTLHEEYKAIADSGLLVQIDDAYLPIYYDLMVPEKTPEQYHAWASKGIEALNHALRGIPEERVRYHVCWGSWNGPHTNDVPIKQILDLILKVNAGSYSIEMANPRHEHEWKVWDGVKLPDGKTLAPGVISHCTNVVEHPELVAERLVRLANLVGRQNLVASTDCGFAQGPFYRRVHPSIMWAKLKTLAEGARLASKELWRN